MEQTITVAGLEVTQTALDRMFSSLRSHHWFGIPGTYKPRLESFRPIDGTRASYEQIVYDTIAGGSAPEWLLAEFSENHGRKPARRTDPRDTLRKAGFPRIAYDGMEPWSQETPQRIVEWAEHAGGEAWPWLWVTCGSDRVRLAALAQASLAAASLSAEGFAIRYAAAAEMCNEIGSANLYGENSKHNALAPYRHCDLLLLDGVGGERHRGPELDALEALLRSRHDNMLPTVLCSRMQVDWWVRAYDHVDRARAESLGELVVSGLCTYQTDPADLAEVMEKRVVGL